MTNQTNTGDTDNNIGPEELSEAAQALLHVQENAFEQQKKFSGRVTEALETEKIAFLKAPLQPMSPQRLVQRLDGMGRVHREKFLKEHPEHQHLWDNKESYLNPAVT